MITARKDSAIQTSLSQLHLQSVCRLFAKLVDGLSVFSMKLHFFPPIFFLNNFIMDISSFLHCFPETNGLFLFHPPICLCAEDFTPRFYKLISQFAPTFYSHLKAICPSPGADNTTDLSQEPANY